MITVRRESPFVQVYAANENTVVHIRQLIHNNNDQATPSESSDGVVMTLMQFRSLMFHLRALDAQFTQGVDFTQDEEKNNDGDENLYAKNIGEKRSWNDAIGNDDEEATPMHDQERCMIETKRNDVIDEIANHAWSELDNIFSTLAPSDTHDAHVPEPIQNIEPMKKH